MIINNNIETRTETDQIEMDNSFNELIVVLVARANYTLCLSEKTCVSCNYFISVVLISILEKFY